MKLTRLYTGNDNHSHFEDLGEIEIFSSNPDGGAFISKSFAVKEFIYAEHPKKYNFQWHVAPRHEYVIVLDGAFKITVNDGTSKIFKNGDILLVEDFTGSGHIGSYVAGCPPMKCILCVPK